MGVTIFLGKAVKGITVNYVYKLPESKKNCRTS